MSTFVVNSFPFFIFWNELILKIETEEAACTFINYLIRELLICKFI